ncbi:minichromosome maintenance protein MCM [Halorubrum distributum]|uniref:DNA helicase n=1 Tax=Halorubrum distributum TaxID=29283 RepID=A0A6B1I974_9EURY|nr:minichromosome maintenance protein MCM [Halorubrum terrestre]MYL15687.1 AAA domain-containing protein [Halorubrum terrestre]MYL67808.1 AAA domain-containing protein [Halorubrum terrestre]
MSTTHDRRKENETLTETLTRFLRERYRDAVGTLAQRYPNEQRSLVIDYDELFEFDHAIAEDVLAKPGEMREYFEEALRAYDLPADVDLANAHVRVSNLPAEHTYYPGGFSPTEQASNYRAITGEVSKVTDQYSKIVEAAFECRRCGTMTYIPQTDSGFQEPHECQGCERQGPFDVNYDQSAFVDAQQFRLATPPEISEGSGTEIDVFVEDDLADIVTAGDRVTVAGTIHLEQQTQGNEKTGKFEPYIDAGALEVNETDHTDVDVMPEERERIHELADGAEGDPLDLAADSLAPKIYGNDKIKRVLILAQVGGSKTVYSDGTHDRGEFHVLLLGDPGTAKSKLIDRVEDLGWRTVGVSGKGATVAGVTASAVQDDFGDGGSALEAGAFVKAHKGAVCIDELDDMPADVRAAMLDPMSKQRISINKWGINATLRTETAVVAAGNPKYGRFNPYEAVQDQFDLESNLLSRFDLVFTLTDQPDPDRDSTITRHILDARDAAKREMADLDVSDEAADTIATPVDRDLLRKWIALAKQQPEPVFASEDVKEWLDESFTDLRSLNGYDEDSPVPVTFRKLEGIVRIAEAAAKFEFSETIEMRHVQFATNVVGESMRDYGTDEDGIYDADVQETGRSLSQKQKIELLEETVTDLQPAGTGGAELDEVVAELEDEGIQSPWDLIEAAKNDGRAYEPGGGGIRWVGDA